MTPSDLISDSAKLLLNHIITFKSFNSCIGYSLFGLTNNAYAHNMYNGSAGLAKSSPVPSKTFSSFQFQLIIGHLWLDFMVINIISYIPDPSSSVFLTDANDFQVVLWSKKMNNGCTVSLYVAS